MCPESLRLPVLLLLSASAALAAGESTPPSVAPVAVYSGGTLSWDEYRGWLAHRGVEDSPQNRLEEVQSLLLTKTLAAQAEAAGLAARDHLESRIRNSQDRVLSAAYRAAFLSRVVVTPEEIETTLAGIPEASFHRPLRLELWNIFKRLPPNSGDEAREELRRKTEGILAALRVGEPFPEVARRESDSSTREAGGSMGWVEPASLRSDVAAVAATLGPGEYSPVLETGDGFTILYCSDVQPEATASPSERRAFVEKQLREQRFAEAWTAELESLRQAIQLELDHAALRGGDPDAVVARYSLGELTLGQLRSFGDVESLDDEDLRRKLENLLLHTLAADRARREGLDRSPEMRVRLDWQRRAGLSHAELQRLVREEDTLQATAERGAADARRAREIELQIRRRLLEQLAIDLSEPANAL